MRQKPSIRAIRAVAFKNEGMSKRKALKKAGYSVAVQNQPHKVFNSKGVQEIILGMKDRLQDKGLTIDYIAAKFQEWLEATDKEGKPNYEVQLKAHDRWKDYMKEGEETKAGKLRRKVTFEDFSWGDMEDLKKDDEL